MEDLAHIPHPNAQAWWQIVDAIETGENTISCGFLPDEIDCPVTLDPAQSAFGEFVRRLEFRPFRLGEDLPSSLGQGEGKLLLCVVDRSNSSAESFSTTVAGAMGLSLEHVVASDVGTSRLVQAISQAALILNFSSDWTLSFAIDELATRLGRGLVRFTNPGYSPIRYALLGRVLPSELIPHKNNVQSSKFLTTFKSQISFQRKNLSLIEKIDIRELSSSFWLDLFDPKAALLFWRRTGVELSAFRETASWVDRFSGWPALWKLLSGASLSSLGQKAISKTIINSSNIWRESRQRIGVVNSALAVCASCGEEWLRFYGSEFVRTPSDVPQLLQTMDEVDFAESQSTVARVLGFLSSLEDAKSVKLLVGLRDAWRFRWDQIDVISKPNLEVSEKWRRLFYNSFRRSINEVDGDVGARHQLSGRGGLSLFETSMGAAGPLVYLYFEFRFGDKLSSRRNFEAMLGGISDRLKVTIAPLLRVAFASAEEYLGSLACLTASSKLQFEDAVWLICSCWSTKRGWLLRKRHLDLNVEYELEIAVMLVSSVSISSSENYRFLEFSARLVSIAGRNDLLEIVLKRLLTLDKSKAARLACRCGLDLLSRGCFDQAGDLLARFPISRNDASIDCFFRAVVAHYCRDERRVCESLDVLKLVDGRFFEDRTALDGRWPWIAVLLGEPASNEVVGLLRVNNLESIDFIQDSGLPAYRLGEAWELALEPLQA